ncbi:MAG: hypothetical protein HZR80_03790 [Candidatus Heimdallarchaeota archaeon]
MLPRLLNKVVDASYYKLWGEKMVNLRTENIRCILCNKQLSLFLNSNNKLFICSVCQAYFCPECLDAIKNYQLCPAARLLGASEHELKFLKMLPSRPLETTGQIVQNNQSETVKILPKKTVRILDTKKKTDKK